MSTETNRLSYLLQRLHAGNASEAEEAELQQLLHNTGETQEAILRELFDATPANQPLFSHTTSEQLLNNILHPPSQVVPIHRRKRMAMIAAAAALVIAIAGAWWFTQSTTAPAAGIVQQPHPAIVPGGDKAVLTLADGSTIVLDSSQNGLLSQQGNVKVIKVGGQLAYDNAHNPTNQTAGIAYNTLSTPRGGQYMLLLEDGSKVWLNAASSIRYPTIFSTKERIVELTGEAYLEIAKNPTRPFRVMVRGMQVEVLGTRFNVNAYGDERTINTTLLEGSVKISIGGKEPKILKPGQQAQLTTAGSISIVEGVDLEEVVAWKDGLFQFNKADLHTVMRQIARWYDVDIAFEGNLPVRYFGGKISRNSNITEVLRVLQLSKIQARIEGRKLIVSP